MPAPDADDVVLLTAAVREAGAIARRFFEGSYRSWSKESGDPVTEADIAVDNFLKTRLRAARPAYAWLSEESADDAARLSAERVFIVDPIDGTYGFIKRRPQFTIVAAVVENGRPISGAIYNPITDEMFEAALGQGAKCNGETIRVSAQSDFHQARILANRDFMAPERWATPWPAGLTAENRASLAYRMALVAQGAFDAMVSLSDKADWDLAAGDLIVHEAGGLVTNEQGAMLRYNNAPPRQGSVIAAGPRLHEKMIARLREFRPAPDAAG